MALSTSEHAMEAHIRAMSPLSRFESRSSYTPTLFDAEKPDLVIAELDVARLRSQIARAPTDSAEASDLMFQLSFKEGELRRLQLKERKAERRSAWPRKRLLKYAALATLAISLIAAVIVLAVLLTRKDRKRIQLRTPHAPGASGIIPGGAVGGQ